VNGFNKGSVSGKSSKGPGIQNRGRLVARPVLSENLYLDDRLHGAYINACPTFSAGILIDYIGVTALMDSFRRTFIGASAACGACISDFISHTYLRKILCLVNA
jgi:hypothetical protein